MKRTTKIFYGLKLLEVGGFCLINYLIYLLGKLLYYISSKYDWGISIVCENPYYYSLCAEPSTILFWVQGLLTLFGCVIILILIGGFIGLTIIKKNKKWARKIDDKYYRGKKQHKR